MAAVTPSQRQKNPRDNIVDKAWDTQERLEGRLANIGRGKYGRVLRMARKPTTEEYQKAALVAGIGLAVLGFIGFTIYYFMRFIPQ